MAERCLGNGLGGVQVLRHLERSDLGCGGGGGRDSADVFRLAGLTFITNANAQAATGSKQSPKQSVTVSCPAHLLTCLPAYLCVQVTSARPPPEPGEP